MGIAGLAGKCYRVALLIHPQLLKHSTDRLAAEVGVQRIGAVRHWQLQHGTAGEAALQLLKGIFLALAPLPSLVLLQ